MSDFLTAGPPALLEFEPNDAQRPFMQSRATERWFIAGNRSGKTYMGVVDMVLDLAGIHQYRPRFGDVWEPEREFSERAKRGAMRAWSCAPDMPNIWKVTQRKYFQKFLKALVGSDVKIWYELDHKFAWRMVVQGPSGRVYEWDCEIFGKSYDAGREKFQSAGLATVWFDEEPPYAIYDEATTRFDSDWALWINGTMTPVNGMTWLYQQIYVPWEAGDREREIFKGSMLDNLTNLPEKEVRRKIRLYPKNTQEYAIRIRGEFIRRTGLIYPQFDRNVHVIPDFDPMTAGRGHYTLYRAVDPGWNNPTACVWAAVNKEGEVFIYREYEEREKPLSEHCFAIRGSSPLEEQYRYTVIDPAARQGDPVTGQSILDYFVSQGIPVIPGDNDVQRGISTVQDYLRVDDGTQRPRFFVCESCRNLIGQFLSYSWKKQTSRAADRQNPSDAPEKKDDHLIDAARYLLMSKPMYWDPPVVQPELAANSDNPWTGY